MRNRRYNVTPNYIYLRPWYRTNQSGTEQHWDATEQTTIGLEQKNTTKTKLGFSSCMCYNCSASYVLSVPWTIIDIVKRSRSRGLALYFRRCKHCRDCRSKQQL